MKIHRIHDNRHTGDSTRFENTAPHPITLLSLVIALLLTPTMGQSLAASFNLDELSDRDAKTLEAIAAHPTAARHAALVVAGYPETLLEIHKIQQSSADDFAALLDSHPRKTQETIWGLVRHRGLTAELGRGGRKTNAQLKKIAAAFPAEDRAAIIEEGRDRYSLWVQIYALDLHVEHAFSMQLSLLPEDVSKAFQNLTAYPELATLLIGDMRTTTVLGAGYRDDRAGVENFLSTLHDKVADQRAQDERDWADEVADPEAAKELETAARAFAEEYDYDLTEVGTAVESAPTQNILVTHRVKVDPYPFWFGYPHWYGVAYWYPRPIWGHVGFHFGSGHSYASFGLPSLLFLDWYHGSYRTKRTNFRSRFGYSSRHRTFPRRISTRRDRYYDRHQPKISKRHRRHHTARAQRTDRERNRNRDSQTRRVRRGEERESTHIRKPKRERRNKERAQNKRRTARRDESGVRTAPPPRAKKARSHAEKRSKRARHSATSDRRTSSTNRQKVKKSDRRRARATADSSSRRTETRRRSDRSARTSRSQQKVRGSSKQRSSRQNRFQKHRSSRRR